MITELKTLIATLTQARSRARRGMGRGAGAGGDPRVSSPAKGVGGAGRAGGGCLRSGPPIRRLP